MTAKPPKLEFSPAFTIWRDPAIYASFPSLLNTAKGTMIAFRAAPREPHDLSGPGHQQHLHPRSSLALAMLDDNLGAGPFWLFPPDLYAADQDPNLLRLPDGAILMSSFSWRPSATDKENAEGPGMMLESTSGAAARFWGGFTARSEDDGLTWQPRVWLPPLPGYPDLVPGQRRWLGGRHRGQVLALPDGRLLIGSYDRLASDQPFQSFIHESHDGGRSWGRTRILGADPQSKAGFVEPTLYTLANGDLLALFRTFGLKDRLAVARSSDQGETWTKPQPVEVTGHPFYITTLNDDWALAVYARRGDTSSIHARLLDRHTGEMSDDELCLRWGAQTRDIGYPTALVLPDRRILVSYYWVDETGARYIEGVTAVIE